MAPYSARVPDQVWRDSDSARSIDLYRKMLLDQRVRSSTRARRGESTSVVGSNNVETNCYILEGLSDNLRRLDFEIRRETIRSGIRRNASEHCKARALIDSSYKLAFDVEPNDTSNLRHCTGGESYEREENRQKSIVMYRIRLAQHKERRLKRQSRTQSNVIPFVPRIGIRQCNEKNEKSPFLVQGDHKSVTATKKREKNAVAIVRVPREDVHKKNRERLRQHVSKVRSAIQSTRISMDINSTSSRSDYKPYQERTSNKATGFNKIYLLGHQHEKTIGKLIDGSVQSNPEYSGCSKVEFGFWNGPQRLVDYDIPEDELSTKINQDMSVVLSHSSSKHAVVNASDHSMSKQKIASRSIGKTFDQTEEREDDRSSTSAKLSKLNPFRPTIIKNMKSDGVVRSIPAHVTDHQESRLKDTEVTIKDTDCSRRMHSSGSVDTSALVDTLPTLGITINNTESKPGISNKLRGEKGKVVKFMLDTSDKPSSQEKCQNSLSTDQSSTLSGSSRENSTGSKTQRSTINVKHEDSEKKLRATECFILCLRSTDRNFEWLTGEISSNERVRRSRDMKMREWLGIGNGLEDHSLQTSRGGMMEAVFYDSSREISM